ncbi:putative bifunctional diguanylate cyclase/phosphodiesterase [Roseibium algae]
MEGLDGLLASEQTIDPNELASLRSTSDELLIEISDYTRGLEANVDQMLKEKEKITEVIWFEVMSSIALLLLLSMTALALFIGNRRTLRQLREANGHDHLTGLANRGGFSDAMDQRVKARNPVPHALIVFDLDHFKQINDQHGHPQGDSVLKEAAQCLIKTFEGRGIIARWGGDEFVAAIEMADNSLHDIKQKLTTLITTPPSIQINGGVIPIDFSCGIALWPSNGNTVNEVMIRADAALYEAKEGGRKRFVFYSEDITARRKEQDEIRASLSRALSDGELFLEFQPQFCFSSESYVGAEALLRWRCSTSNEMIPPGKFIPIAEESGQIWAIDKFVLDEACRTAADWARRGLGQKRIAVNLSPHSFQRLGLAAIILNTLERWSLTADALEIEITEGVLLTDSQQVETNLADIAKLGVRIALDDFGTGYSNIAYLAKLKPDLLKIDRSFLKEANHHTRASIVQGIERLASTLGAETLVEGIETADELQFVKDAGCQLIQGFLLARPMRADKIAAFWLKNQQANETGNSNQSLLKQG